MPDTWTVEQSLFVSSIVEAGERCAELLRIYAQADPAYHERCEEMAAANGLTIDNWCSSCGAIKAWRQAVHSDGQEGGP